MLTTQWDGRFTVAHARPLIIVDGAHNEDAWVKLRESVDKYFTNQRIVYIMGVFRDKEYKKMIQILAPTMDKDKIIVITISGRGDKDCAAIARYRGENINE